MKMEDEKEHYPSFTYSGKKDLDLPEEGVMKIRFRKVRSSESKMGDHTMHECTVEVESIESVKGEREEAEDEAPTRKEHGTEDALDALAREHMGRY